MRRPVSFCAWQQQQVSKYAGWMISSPDTKLVTHAAHDAHTLPDHRRLSRLFTSLARFTRKTRLLLHSIKKLHVRSRLMPFGKWRAYSTTSGSVLKTWAVDCFAVFLPGITSPSLTLLLQAGARSEVLKQPLSGFANS